MYSFLLTLTKTDATLELREGERVITTKKWQESRDMGQQLFEAIQSLLQENGLGPIDVDNFQLKTEVSDNFTSVKIAETVMKVYNWSVSVAVNNNQK